MFQIGKVQIKNPVVLAPMAGVCNAPFRLLIKEFGAGLVCAEMVSDKAILYQNKKTLDMLYIDEREKPLSLQIFGGEKETLVEAARYVEKYTDCDMIDINMGCPVNKITKAAAGAIWLKDTEKIYDAVSAVVLAVNRPVTVKVRLGWDEQSINIIENAKAIEAAGASAIAIHGRTRAQLYEGQANWDYIRQVKEQVKIPVIGNGDVKTPQDAKRMLAETGADGVMIGRGALGNPWMIYETVRYLETGELLPPPTPQEKMKIAWLHMNRMIATKGEKLAILEMRKHMAWYLKGLRGGAKIRNLINGCTTKEEMTNILSQYLDSLQGYNQT